MNFNQYTCKDCLHLSTTILLKTISKLDVLKFP